MAEGQVIGQRYHDCAAYWCICDLRGLESVEIQRVNDRVLSGKRSLIFGPYNKLEQHKKEPIQICESFVFDFMPDTLGSLIENNSLDLVDMKIYTWQMFNGLQYLSQVQDSLIEEKDYKSIPLGQLQICTNVETSQYLADLTGSFEIGDFGSAKVVRPGMTSTPYQVLNSYSPDFCEVAYDAFNVTRLRHPELLLGSENYNWTPSPTSLSREGAKRSNGQLISQCITSADIAEAHSIDESKVKAKLTSIVMRTKLDFSCDDESKESRELNAPLAQKVGASKEKPSTESVETGEQRKKPKKKLRGRSTMMAANPSNSPAVPAGEAADLKRFPISPASIGLPNLLPPQFEGVIVKSTAALTHQFSHDGSMPSQGTEWCINAADQVKYDSIFDSLCPIDGKLPGAKVRPVLLNSGLNPAILAKIWELADQDKDGQLDRIEMTVAMHLVYRALQNEPVPAVLPNSLIHPSKMSLTRRTSTASVASMHAGNGSFNFGMPPQSQFIPGQANYRSRTGSMTSLDGVGHTTKLPPVENRSASVQPNQGSRNESAPATPVRGMGGPLSMSVGSSSNSSLEWPVDRLASAAQFAACDTDSDGLVNGNDVKHVLLGSGLPQQALAHIWALCDINRTGKLNQEQFALIVHLVNMRKRGEELPSTLPQFLIPPSLRVLSVSENGHSAPDANTVNAEHISASDSGEMRRLAEKWRNSYSDRREADAQVSQLEADMKVKDSQIKNLQVELRTLEVTVKQLERQKTEAGRRLADLDEQIRQLEAAALAQAKKAEEAQSRLNQLVEDTQKDAAHADGAAKRQRDEAQRVQLNEAIAHAETVVNDIQNVLKSADPTTELSSKLSLLEDISRKDLFNDVPFSIASTSNQAIHQPPDPFTGVQTVPAIRSVVSATMQARDVRSRSRLDPLLAACASGNFAIHFPQDPFGGGATAGGGLPMTLRQTYMVTLSLMICASCYWNPLQGGGVMSVIRVACYDEDANGGMAPDPSTAAAKNPPPRPAPPKSSARQTPVNGDPFANTDPFAAETVAAAPGGGSKSRLNYFVKRRSLSEDI
ncbi:EF hand [Ostertagia ostertagi]